MLSSCWRSTGPAWQGEALAVYTDRRTLLIDELGIEPGKELRELQRAILAQDPGLLLVRPARLASAETGGAGIEQSGKPRRPGRRRSLLLSAAGLLAVAAALVSVPMSGSRNPAAPGMIQPGSVAFIDARSGRVVGDVPAAPGVGFVRSGLGSVWEMEDAGVLLQINPRTRHLTRSISVGVNAGDVAVGEGAVWITDKDSQTLLRVGPQYGDVARIRPPASGLSRPGVGGGVAVGAGSVWVAQGLSRILRINPASGQVESSVPVADANVVAFGGGAVWVASSDLGTLTKIDPRTGTVVAGQRGSGPGYAASPPAAVTSGRRTTPVSGSLQPTAGCSTRSRLPPRPATSPSATGRCGSPHDAAGTVMRIDPRTDATSKYRVGHLLTGIGVSGQTVAVSVHPDASDLLAHLSGPVLQVRNQDWFNSTDPAVAAEPGTAGQPWEQQLQYATCARLLGYP